MIDAKLMTLAFAVTNVLGASQIYNHFSDEAISELNRNAITWKAGRNFALDTPMEYLNSLGCAVPINSTSMPVRTHDLSSPSSDLPQTFDARKRWKNCLSLREIRDQGQCGDCWAIAATETITDRECIHKNRKFHASTVDIISCCQNCHFLNACKAGYTERAFEYYVNSGVVSGGSFGTHTGCKPYEKLEHDRLYVPPCVKRCARSYHRKYSEDLHHGHHAYTLHGEKQMMAEIYKNGPVVVVFQLFEDMYHYKSGVYKHTAGSSAGYHAVKVLGWGIERNTPYWLIANSWSARWGDRGLFKFLRGSNHCGIEGSAYTALP